MAKRTKTVIPRDEINYTALVMLVENNIMEFEEYAGSEEVAEQTLKTLRDKAGMFDESGLW